MTLNASELENPKDRAIHELAAIAKSYADKYDIGILLMMGYENDGENDGLGSFMAENMSDNLGYAFMIAGMSKCKEFASSVLDAARDYIKGSNRMDMDITPSSEEDSEETTH